MPDHDLPDGEARVSFKRPTNFVAAVIDDERDLRLAIDELVSAGISMDAIGVLSGQRGVQSFVKRPRAFLEGYLNDVPEHLARYEDELRAGHHVLAVILPDDQAATRDRVRALLKTRGARQLLASTRWTHTEEA